MASFPSQPSTFFSFSNFSDFQVTTDTIASLIMDPVKLVVKAPNQQIEDQIMEVDLNWTVLDLKKHISNYYPSKPVSCNTSFLASIFLSFFAVN